MKSRTFLPRYRHRLLFFLILCILCAVFTPFGRSSVPAAASAASHNAPAQSPAFSGIRRQPICVSADFALPLHLSSAFPGGALLSAADDSGGAACQLLLLRSDGLFRFGFQGRLLAAPEPASAAFSLTLPAVQLDVAPIFQNELLLPNGCEGVSLAMLMQFHGIAVDAYDFTLRCIPRQDVRRLGFGRFAPNPNKAYIGDPSDPGSGWYCFEDPVIAGANRYLSERGAAFSAEKISGADYTQLWYALYTGHPVAVWLTADYLPPRRNPQLVFTLPDGRRYRPYRNLHCLLLTGMADDRVFLADPKRGNISIPRDQFFSLYNAMGRRAVILKSTS